MQKMIYLTETFCLQYENISGRDTMLKVNLFSNLKITIHSHIFGTATIHANKVPYVYENDVCVLVLDFRRFITPFVPKPFWTLTLALPKHNTAFCTRHHQSDNNYYKNLNRVRVSGRRQISMQKRDWKGPCPTRSLILAFPLNLLVHCQTCRNQFDNSCLTMCNDSFQISRGLTSNSLCNIQVPVIMHYCLQAMCITNTYQQLTHRLTENHIRWSHNNASSSIRVT